MLVPERVHVTIWARQTTITSRCSSVASERISVDGNVLVCTRSKVLWSHVCTHSNKESTNLPQVTSICLQWQHEEGSVAVHCTGQSPQDHQTSYRNMRMGKAPQSMKYWPQRPKSCHSAYTEHASEGKYFINVNILQNILSRVFFHPKIDNQTQRVVPQHKNMTQLYGHFLWFVTQTCNESSKLMSVDFHHLRYATNLCDGVMINHLGAEADHVSRLL